MNYETIKHLKDSDFKRLTGVQRETFDTVFEVALVDVSEQPVERPKKAKNGIIVAKRSGYPKSAGDCGSKKRPNHNHRV